MFSREVFTAFDNDIEAAHNALAQGEETSPDIVTPARAAELRTALDCAYLPNVDSDGVVSVQAADHPTSEIAYLPSVAMSQVRTISVRLEDQTLDVPYQTNSNTAMATLYLGQPATPYALRYYTYAIVEPEDDSIGDSDPRDRESKLLHELVHTRQNFREPSIYPTPPELADTPTLVMPSLGQQARTEVEAYWFQFPFYGEDLQQIIRDEAAQIEEWRRGERDDFNVQEVSVMHYLTDQGFIDAYREPPTSILRLLEFRGIISRGRPLEPTEPTQAL